MDSFREFNYINLGATLYVPATHKNIKSIANGTKYKDLRSVVFCLEDAIRDDEIQSAIDNISSMLKSYKQSNIKVFIRPRDTNNLKTLLDIDGIEKIDGFSLAKFSLNNMDNYFNILNQTTQKYHLMPVLESIDIFDIEHLKKMREFLLLQKKHNIITLRVGGQDMFNFLSLKKDCESSVHDFHISSQVFSNLLIVFKTHGFNITAPVYNCLEHLNFFKYEVQRDLKEGFFGKTLIHPSQIEITNRCYKVTKSQFDEASLILDIKSDAIFRFEDSMCEPASHQNWAKTILQRAQEFGVK
jgi:citrate lyase beta subunit